MKIIVVLLLALFVSTFFFTRSSFAEEIKKNGYTIKLFSRQKSKRVLTVKGKIKGGKSCRELELSIWMKNRKLLEADLGHVQVYIHNYRPGRTQYFKEIDDSIYNVSSAFGKYWFVKNLYITCHN